MEEETAGTANDLIERLSALQQKTGIRLASVADRVQRPFTAMLEQDELESLVEPAVRELLAGEPQGAGTQLETHAEEFLGVATGAAREVPDWLALKILAVGAIFCAGVLLDLLFKPAVDLFMALAATPDDLDLNAAYSRALSPVYIAVLAIYAFALIAAALGVFK